MLLGLLVPLLVLLLLLLVMLVGWTCDQYTCLRTSSAGGIVAKGRLLLLELYSV